jgi:outer membrane protein TolC
MNRSSDKGSAVDSNRYDHTDFAGVERCRTPPFESDPPGTLDQLAMNRRHCLAIALIGLLLSTAGCSLQRQEFHFPERQIGPHEVIATQIEYPDVEATMTSEVAASGPPRATQNPGDQEPLDMTLAEATRLAFSNSPVIRSLGGSVVAAPSASATLFNPAIIESDPRGSVEAALSAFDTQLTSALFWNKMDRGSGQVLSGLPLPAVQQLASDYQLELAKTAATGSRFALRHHLNYNREYDVTDPTRFPSVWNIDYEAEFRQPLLRGAGVEFNRIAGPNSAAGGANGVLLARLNTDVGLADFEAAVTNLARDVEQAYWDLYFAYRDLDAKIAGRDSALVTWQNIAERLRIGLRGGTPENESQLRSQYFGFQASVDDALAALYSREERLRYLLGMPPNGPQLIRPATEPPTAKVVYSWHDVLNEAYIRRVELRRQKWQIKRRELELIAAKNYLKPRLDAVALYRFRGFGDELIAPPGPTGVESAYQNLTTGDFQEWQLGFQFDVPIGFRREFAAMRNAELQLARERALLEEQEFRVSHDVSEAMRSAERAFQLMRTNLNRRLAAHDEVQALQARFEVGFTQLDVLLRAEQRRAESNIAYYRSLVDYSLALRDVHYAKGSLLEYDGVSLAEGPWSRDAYRDALERSRHFAPRVIDYGLRRPRPISRGPYLPDGGSLLDNAPRDGSTVESVETPPPGEALPSPRGVLPGEPTADDPPPPPSTR